MNQVVFDISNNSLKCPQNILNWDKNFDIMSFIKAANILQGFPKIGWVRDDRSFQRINTETRKPIYLQRFYLFLLH